jgi:hypothetical protein
MDRLLQHIFYINFRHKITSLHAVEAICQQFNHHMHDTTAPKHNQGDWTAVSLFRDEKVLNFLQLPINWRCPKSWYELIERVQEQFSIVRLIANSFRDSDRETVESKRSDQAEPNVHGPTKCHDCKWRG